jgi:flavodoxin
MKTLIVYYTRTGNTKKIAETIQQHITGDIEEIIDTKNRKGLLGYLRSGRQALAKKLADINEITHDLKAYDLIIIGTPIWVGTISSPIRTCIEHNKDDISQAAFFATSGGGNAKKLFDEMQQLLKKQPIAALSIRQKQLRKHTFEKDVKKFIEKIINK